MNAMLKAEIVNQHFIILIVLCKFFKRMKQILFQDGPRLLSASSWMTSEAGPSTRGDFVASTIDVDAIKVSKYLFTCTNKS